MGGSLVPHVAAFERHFFLANRQVPVVDDLGCHINSAVVLEIDQVRLSVFEFIQGWLFASRAVDIGELVVMVNFGNEERSVCGVRRENIVKLEFGGVTRARAVDFLGGLSLRSSNLVTGLCAKRLKFLLVGLQLGGAHISS